MSQKTAIVTGGTRGIGRAISIDLAQRGYLVFAVYARNKEAASALEDFAKTKSLSIECVRGDMSDDVKLNQIITEIRQKTEKIDVVIHAAASGVHKDSMSLSQKHLDWTFQTNVFAIHNLLREVLPMIPRGGRIIGITSNGGEKVIPYYAAVGSSKGAMNALFRHYAWEFAPKGISVNLVCPGMVITDALDAFPERDERVKSAVERTPTGRLTTPEDVASLVAFLCSEAAAQIIGQTIVMDGGKGLLS